MRWFPILLLVTLVLSMVTQITRLNNPGSLPPTTKTSIADLIVDTLLIVGVVHFYIIGGN